MEWIGYSPGHRVIQRTEMRRFQITVIQNEDYTLETEIDPQIPLGTLEWAARALGSEARRLRRESKHGLVFLAVDLLMLIFARLPLGDVRSVTRLASVNRRFRQLRRDPRFDSFWLNLTSQACGDCLWSVAVIPAARAWRCPEKWVLNEDALSVARREWPFHVSGYHVYCYMILKYDIGGARWKWRMRKRYTDTFRSFIPHVHASTISISDCGLRIGKLMMVRPGPEPEPELGVRFLLCTNDRLSVAWLRCPTDVPAPLTPEQMRLTFPGITAADASRPFTLVRLTHPWGTPRSSTQRYPTLRMAEFGPWFSHHAKTRWGNLLVHQRSEWAKRPRALHQSKITIRKRRKKNES